MRIGVDVDDVLTDWFDRAHQACVDAGIANDVVPTSWEPFHEYGVTQDDWLAVMEAVTLNGWLYSGEPFPGAVAALQSLKDAGHTIHIVTARGFFKHGHLIRAATIEWFNHHEIPHDSLTFSKDKTLVRTDVFVDDSWKNVSALVAAGVPTWMVDAPHNKTYEYDRRVSSIVEFANEILKGAAA